VRSLLTLGCPLRNLFDQYSQPENRFTHALLTALNEDRYLLELFLRELVKAKPPVKASKLSILEQRFPGEEEPSDEDDLDRRGIPDGWIFDSEGWCVFIETKVLAKFRVSQIESHRRTAVRRGFRQIIAVVITSVSSQPVPPDTVHLQWSEIYVWLRRHAAVRPWAARVTDFLEIAEAKLIGRGQFVEGTLTTFSGFPFGHDRPFTYLEGKRVLALALDKLRNRKDLRTRLGMNPENEGRGAITGRQGDAVWDYLSLSQAADARNFTKYPHLTLGISSSQVEAMVTLPDKINATMRGNVKQLGPAGFQTLISEILTGFKPLLRKHKGVTPWFRGIQRRYPAQRSTPFIDARIDFDLRTAVPKSGAPKAQPLWLSSAYGAFVKKAGSNYQMQVGAIFPYFRCPELREADAIELIASVWLACKPLVDLRQ
jgi:hypothetical protein